MAKKYICEGEIERSCPNRHNSRVWKLGRQRGGREFQVQLTICRSSSTVSRAEDVRRFDRVGDAAVDAGVAFRGASLRRRCRATTVASSSLRDGASAAPLGSKDDDMLSGANVERRGATPLADVKLTSDAAPDGRRGPAPRSAAWPLIGVMGEPGC